MVFSIRASQDLPTLEMKLSDKLYYISQSGHQQRFRAERENFCAFDDRWTQLSENIVNEFEMGFRDGAFPEEQVVEMAALMRHLRNDQTRSTLEILHKVSDFSLGWAM
jgi:hypothetical protein